MKHVSKAFAVFVALCICFSLGFSWRDIRTGSAPSAAAFRKLLTGNFNSTETPTQLFQRHYNIIQSSFYRPVDEKQLTHAGMAGLLASLGDPHTVFMEPELAEDFAIETSGNYAGVGARLQGHALGALVVTVFKDGPADRAGLQVDDIVVKVDDLDVDGMGVDQIVDFVRGEEGTPITMTVQREGFAETIEIRIVRGYVIVPTVDGRLLLDSYIAYISIDSFGEPTAQQFKTVLEGLDGRDPAGLIIDLRNNPGGLLEITVEMLSLFVDDKLAVTLKRRGSRSERLFTRRGQTLGINYPITVLVNRYSASAAEIFSGVLRDYHVATIVGEHTYGKASVQNVILLRDLSTAKITNGRYFLPSGENISRKVDADGVYVSGGIKPQVLVEASQGIRWKAGDPESDKVLQAAIELIEEKNRR